MALLSAIIGMPDSGLEIIKDRFKSEIFIEKEAAEDKKSEEKNPLNEYFTEEEEDYTESPDEDIDGDKKRIPKIPAKYAAEVISENFAGNDEGNFIKYDLAFIRNETKFDDEDIEEILKKEANLKISDSSKPTVLIVHTHATESFETYDRTIYDTRNTWRSTDNTQNMVRVGEVFCEVLEEYGIGVIHDTTQHDYPSYNGSYERSAKTISDYLEEYPSIKIVLDLHRDGIQRDESIVKPVAEINGKKAAQIMIISACDDGTMDIPKWRENFRFATAFQNYMESFYPGLTRPVYLCYRKYNMDLTTGSLLLEFGSNANTLDEAVYSAEMAGHALAELITDAEAGG